MSKKLYALSRTIHQYVSMLMLVLALFFAVTGLTLNHPDWFVGEPELNDVSLQLPQPLLNQALSQRKVDSQVILDYLEKQQPLQGQPTEQDLFTEWDNDELLEGELSIAFQGPGYHASIFVDLASGEAEISERDAGTIALLNDLHKGRYSGAAWSLVIDISAVLMTLFVLSGAILVLPNRRLGNKLLWLAGFGSLLTALLALTTR